MAPNANQILRQVRDSLRANTELSSSSHPANASYKLVGRRVADFLAQVS